jgi:DNA-binding CsgD family transcriptional regulator
MGARRLLEREAEVAELTRLATEALSANSSIVVIEGPAGIGKTALLDAAREASVDLNVRVVHARASELDRSYVFGIVHQLLEPMVVGADDRRRDALFAGAASRAEIVFSADVEAAAESEYAVLHGLYWLLANLAAEQPLVILVDDLQWADSRSLKLLEYLGRRLEGLPICVLATLRPNEPGAEADILDAIVAGPATRILRPAALSSAAAREILRETLGAEPDETFTRAAIEATSGNPLLLRVAAREAGALGLRGDPHEAPALLELAARGVAPAVERRLRGLGRVAIGLARAAAVAGERVGTDELAELAGIEAHDAHMALDQLGGAGILQGRSATFVHPLIRQAVLEAMPLGDRTHLHAAMARRLRERGAKPSEIATHLLATDGASGDDPDVVDTLREAARAVSAEGDPGAGARFLARALREPLSESERGRVLLELGELEVRADETDGIAHLESAIETGLTGDELARAYAALGGHRVHGDPHAAMADFERALAEARDPGLRLRLEALILEMTVFPQALAQRRIEILAQGGSGEPSVVMLAHLAQHAAYSGAPAEQTLQLARRALRDGELIRHVSPGTATWNLLVHAMRVAEDAESSKHAIVEGEAIARAQGFHFARFFIDHAWAYWQLDFGSAATAAAHARTGLDQVRKAGLDVTVGALAAIAAEALVEADELEDAARIFELPMDAVEGTIAEPFAVSARGLVRFLQRNTDAAETDFRHVVAMLDDRGWHAPAVTEARARLVWLLAARGELDEAHEHVQRMLDTAQRSAAPGAIALARRSEARVTASDDEKIEILRDAASLLETSQKRLLQSAILTDLGALLRHTGRRRDAREPLRVALDLATRAESTRTAQRARDELAATGAQPRREALSGVAALTPSERRVADLAAEGLSNRQIAETLWVTLKTVEVHLGRTYGKLGIKSRAELPRALGSETRTPAAA